MCSFSISLSCNGLQCVLCYRRVPLLQTVQTPYYISPGTNRSIGNTFGCHICTISIYTDPTTYIQYIHVGPTCMYVLNLGGAIFRESRLISDKQIEGENYCKINMSWTLTGTIYEIAYYVCRLKNWRILKTESVFFFLKF